MQVINFFVNEGDREAAETFRDLRAETDDQVAAGGDVTAMRERLVDHLLGLLTADTTVDATVGLTSDERPAPAPRSAETGSSGDPRTDTTNASGVTDTDASDTTSVSAEANDARTETTGVDTEAGDARTETTGLTDANATETRGTDAPDDGEEVAE